MSFVFSAYFSAVAADLSGHYNIGNCRKQFQRPWNQRSDSGPQKSAALFHVVFRADRDCLEGFLRADNVLHGIAEFVGEAPMCDQYQSDHVHPSLLERSITIRLPHAVSLPDQADKRLIFRLNRHDF